MARRRVGGEEVAADQARAELLLRLRQLLLVAFGQLVGAGAVGQDQGVDGEDGGQLVAGFAGRERGAGDAVQVRRRVERVEEVGQLLQRAGGADSQRQLLVCSGRRLSVLSASCSTVSPAAVSCVRSQSWYRLLATSRSVGSERSRQSCEVVLARLAPRARANLASSSASAALSGHVLVALDGGAVALEAARAEPTGRRRRRRRRPAFFAERHGAASAARSSADSSARSRTVATLTP